MAEFEGKTALVTGASRGIGAAIAVTLANQGAAVVLMARNKSALAELAATINAAGGRAIVAAGDVASYDDVNTAVAVAIEKFGQLDILVNNAGVIEPIARISDSNPDEWSHVVDINLKGVYFGIRASLPAMVSQGGGTIVNISSGAATSALEGWSHYCATKAGVLSLTKCTHKEYADRGVRVFGLSPGTVATEMQHQIKASGINPVSLLDFSEHIPPQWPAQAVAWMCGPAADSYAGDDFSLRPPENRKLVGLTE